MKIQDDEVIFSTGKTLYANRGIIGISPELNVTQGYDSGFYKTEDLEYNFNAADEYKVELCLTTKEAIELADYMIEQWTKFRSKHDSLYPFKDDKNSLWADTIGGIPTEQWRKSQREYNDFMRKETFVFTNIK